MKKTDYSSKYEFLLRRTLLGIQIRSLLPYGDNIVSNYIERRKKEIHEIENLAHKEGDSIHTNKNLDLSFKIFHHEVGLTLRALAL